MAAGGITFDIGFDNAAIFFVFCNTHVTCSAGLWFEEEFDAESELPAHRSSYTVSASRWDLGEGCGIFFGPLQVVKRGLVTAWFVLFSRGNGVCRALLESRPDGLDNGA